MTADKNRATLERFYAAFSQRVGADMADCYHADAKFKDPVFDLSGDEVGAMWRMLCSRGADLRIQHSNVHADEHAGSADWQAWYTFSKSGRAVHNIVNSRFRFEAGKIIEQTDTFGFWRWSKQALGVTGLMLGWTPVLKRIVRTEARRNLNHFMRSEQK